MTKLWIGYAVVIAYGSIYPFNFQTQSLDAPAIQAFLDSCCRLSSRGDILANIILFVPLGFLGIIAGNRGRSRLGRLWVLCLAGAAFALALQFAQFYLPPRNENLQDAGWNVVGLMGGALLGVLSHRYILRPAARPRSLAAVPCLLIGSWVVGRLVPFVPSLDFQSIKDSLKPLLLEPQLQTINIADSTVAWLVVASLLQRVQRGASMDTYLPILIVGVIGLEVLIVNNTVSASNVVGAMLALFFWWAVLRNVKWQAGGLAILLSAMLIARGLSPFNLSTQLTSFNWLPFQGLLGGSMYVNVQAIFEKTFLYGSLVYIMWQTRLNQMAGTMVAIGVVAFIEIAQIYVAGHTPEITDPLLVVVAALTIIALQSQADPSRRLHSARQSSRHRDPVALNSEHVDRADETVDGRPISTDTKLSF